MPIEKLKIPYPVIVEGKYDRIKLLSVIEAPMLLTTGGFEVFRNNEKAAVIRKLAQKSPVIVLTDSDGAGKLIRSHISSLIPPSRLYQLYIPRVKGREKRKKEDGAEGILGVEGMERELLYKLFLPYSDGSAERKNKENPLTKADFYADGLSGKENSASARDALCKAVGLPENMTPNALLAALKLILSYEEYLALVGRGK